MGQIHGAPSTNVGREFQKDLLAWNRSWDGQTIRMISTMERVWFRRSRVALLVGVALLLGALNAAGKKPSFLVFLVDDLGYRDIGAYNPETVSYTHLPLPTIYSV